MMFTTSNIKNTLGYCWSETGQQIGANNILNKGEISALQSITVSLAACKTFSVPSKLTSLVVIRSRQNAAPKAELLDVAQNLLQQPPLAQCDNSECRLQ